MPNSSLAEWLLSLCTSRERAHSIVGDLTEEASFRGMWWFWFQVSSTLAALVWRDLRGASFRIAFLGILGFFLIMFQAYWSPFSWLFLLGWEPSPVASIGMYGLSIASIAWRVAVAPCLVALLVARLSGGRELTSCIALAFICQLPWIRLLAGLVWDGSITALTAFEVELFLDRFVFSSLSLSLPLFAGAAMVRRRALVR